MPRIAVDAMGGDRGPAEVVAGALEAAADAGLTPVLYGSPGVDPHGLELRETDGGAQLGQAIVPADEVVDQRPLPHARLSRHAASPMLAHLSKPPRQFGIVAHQHAAVAGGHVLGLLEAE